MNRAYPGIMALIYLLFGVFIFDSLAAAESNSESSSMVPLLDTEEVAELSAKKMEVIITALQWQVKGSGNCVSPDSVVPPVFLQIFRKNPSSSLLENLKEFCYFKPASDGMYNEGEPHQLSVFDPESGEYTRVITIKRVRVFGKKAKVTISSYTGPMSASGCDVYLVYRTGHWEVAKTSIPWSG